MRLTRIRGSRRPRFGGFWRDNSRFFHKGTSGQWREALSPESLALYDEVKPQRVSPELGEWLEKGSLVCGDPKEL